MALLAIEGFDYWSSTNDGTGKGWTFTGTQGSFALTTGRYGGGCLYSGSLGVATRSLAVQAGAVFYGVAIRFNSIPTSAFTPFDLMSIMTGTSRAGSVRASYSGGLVFSIVDYAGNLSPLPGLTFTAGVWSYIEICVSAGYSASTGVVILRQDGVVVGSVTVQTTASSAANYFDAIQFINPGSPTLSFDDVYAADSSGTVNNSWCGPLRVNTLRPSSDAAPNQWAPDSGTAHYSRVAETNEDGGSSYLFTGTAAQSEMFGFGALTTGLGAILAIQPVVVADGGGNTLKTIVNSAGSQDSGAFMAVPGSFNSLSNQILETDPQTGTAWTRAAVNAVKAGFTNGAP